MTSIELTNKLNHSQGSWSDYSTSISVLFNKGRYFELSIGNKDLLVSLSKAVKVKIQHTDMLVAPKDKLEPLIKACNKRNIYVTINLDWI